GPHCPGSHFHLTSPLACQNRKPRSNQRLPLLLLADTQRLDAGPRSDAAIGVPVGPARCDLPPGGVALHAARVGGSAPAAADLGGRGEPPLPPARTDLENVAAVSGR